MNAKLTNKGFTIIEVVLVIAIAGLIFLMVFIALPALQSGQRDQARKTDVGTVATAVSNFTSNNRGKFPTTTELTGVAAGTPTSEKFAGYVSSVSNNMTRIISRPVTGTATPPATAVVSNGEIVVTQKTTCGTSGAGATATQNLVPGTVRQFTVVTYLEAGGGTSFCQES